MDQLRLLRGCHLPSVFRYEVLFAQLPSLKLPPSLGPGRKPYDPDALLRALVYRCLRRIPTLSDLVFELGHNPSLVEQIGLDPLHPLPTLERFSCFLHRIDHACLRQVRQALVLQLIEQRAISGRVLALDSCAVIAPLRENNLKTRLLGSRFNKEQPPKGDPQSGLGVRVHFSQVGQKQVSYFWGYRNHTVTDAESELTLWEETHPAQVSEVSRAIPLLRAVQQLPLETAFVTADKEYDSEAILAFIVYQLGAQPIVTHNPRRQQPAEYSLKNGEVFCAADLPMAHRGKITNKHQGLEYRQYGCPLHWRKEYQRQYLLCPIGHPKFQKQKGCNVLIRLTPSLRSQIPYGTELFERVYNQRTAVERTFSRLLTITMQQPTARGLNANRNLCTIAHMATLLVALAAVQLGQPDKIRWIRSFVPNFLKT